MTRQRSDDPGAVPVPAAARQERIARLRAAARERDLAAVVICSYGARAGAGTHGHLTASPPACRRWRRVEPQSTVQPKKVSP